MPRKFKKKGRGPGLFSTSNQPDIVFTYGAYRSKSFVAAAGKRRKTPREVDPVLTKLLQCGRVYGPHVPGRNQRRRIPRYHLEARRNVIIFAFTELQSAFLKMKAPRTKYARNRGRCAQELRVSIAFGNPSARHVALFMQQLKPAEGKPEKGAYIPKENVKTVERVLKELVEAGDIKLRSKHA